MAYSLPHWTCAGGLRWPLLARLTHGRLGLGRWTQAEVDEVWARATELYKSSQESIETEE